MLSKVMGAIIYINAENTDLTDIQLSKCKKVCERHSLNIDEILTNISHEELSTFTKMNMKKGDHLIVYSIDQIAPTETYFHNLYEVLQKKNCNILTHINNIDTKINGNNIGLYVWYHVQSRLTCPEDVIDVAKKSIGMDLSFMKHTVETA